MLAAFSKRDLHDHPLLIAHELDVRFGARQEPRYDPRQAIRTIDHRSFDPRDDVAWLDAGRGRRILIEHFIDQHAFLFGHAELFGQLWSQRLNAHTEPAPDDAALLH